MNTTIKPNLGRPALIGGLVMGVLSALPIVSLGNFCCCLWVLGGGIVAAYVLQQEQTAPITAGDGALVGLLAGLCGAVIQVVLSIPITLLAGPIYHALFQRLTDMAGSMPLEMRDALERYNRNAVAHGAMFVIGNVVALMFWLFLGASFSTIGGLIGAAIFKKPAQSGPIDDVIPPTA